MFRVMMKDNSKDIGNYLICYKKQYMNLKFNFKKGEKVIVKYKGKYGYGNIMSDDYITFNGHKYIAIDCIDTIDIENTILLDPNYVFNKNSDMDTLIASDILDNI